MVIILLMGVNLPLGPRTIIYITPLPRHALRAPLPANFHRHRGRFTFNPRPKPRSLLFGDQEYA